MSESVQCKAFVADAAKLPLEDNSVDLVFGSPPYCDARDYGIGAGRKLEDWVDWMRQVTVECLRVSKGPVVWVAAGVGNYSPAVECLIADMHREGVKVFRPCIWTKNAPPTGNGWFSNDWEYVACFTKSKPLPKWRPESIGTPIKYSSGGSFRQRGKDGKRRAGSDYPQHKIRKRPSNVVRFTVGGGHLGHELAHENEAPFPMQLARHFISAMTDPGDAVLDPFCGSGSTAHAAIIEGRNAIATDIRESQVELTKRRIALVKKRMRMAICAI